MEKVNTFGKLLEIARGRLELDAPLASYTCFGVGGSADILFIPEDVEDLSNVLKFFANNSHEPRTTNHEPPITIFGGCSNVLIRDGSIRGLVILTTELREIGLELPPCGGVGGAVSRAGGGQIKCAAGVKSAYLSHFAAENGISGFEFLCGIPGTVGGAVIGNAGAGKVNIEGIASVIESVTIMDFRGNLSTLSNAEMGFDYRKSSLPKDHIIVSVSMRGHIADQGEIRKTMDELTQQRIARQPLGARTCGSLFKNPPNAAAGKLIEDAGWKGRIVNGAGMSEKHANFMVNYGSATASDIESLANAIRKDVFDKFGIELEFENKILGEK